MIRHILFTNKEGTKTALVFRAIVYNRDSTDTKTWRVLVNQEITGEDFPTMNKAMKRANELVESK